MNAIYNEIDPFAASWLEQLVADGHVAPGRVDRRSIADLAAADVAGHGQRHFFAGIGGWSRALRLAGVPDGADVWTGSCPCQPFSSAGRGAGFADDRHLWPDWFRLINECRPSVVFGEQVASQPGLAWLDLVRADLEGAGYLVGAADLCAASVGAPHIRQRLYFVAIARDQRREGLGLHLRERRPLAGVLEARRSGEAGELADSERDRRRARGIDRSHGRTAVQSDRHGDAGILADRASTGRDERHAVGHRSGGGAPTDSGRPGPPHDSEASHWGGCEWLPCSDGRSRPVEPGTFPLAHGVPARVGRLRGYGNAIVPQVAATFVEAAIEALNVGVTT